MIELLVLLAAAVFGMLMAVGILVRIVEAVTGVERRRQRRRDEEAAASIRSWIAHHENDPDRWRW